MVDEVVTYKDAIERIQAELGKAEAFKACLESLTNKITELKAEKAKKQAVLDALTELKEVASDFAKNEKQFEKLKKNIVYCYNGEFGDRLKQAVELNISLFDAGIPTVQEYVASETETYQKEHFSLLKAFAEKRSALVQALENAGVSKKTSVTHIYTKTRIDAEHAYHCTVLREEADQHIKGLQEALPQNSGGEVIRADDEVSLVADLHTGPNLNEITGLCERIKLGDEPYPYIVDDKYQPLLQRYETKSGILAGRSCIFVPTDKHVAELTKKVEAAIASYRIAKSQQAIDQKRWGRVFSACKSPSAEGYRNLLMQAQQKILKRNGDEAVEYDNYKEIIEQVCVSYFTTKLSSANIRDFMGILSPLKDKKDPVTLILNEGWAGCARYEEIKKLINKKYSGLLQGNINEKLHLLLALYVRVSIGLDYTFGQKLEEGKGPADLSLQKLEKYKDELLDVDIGNSEFLKLWNQAASSVVKGSKSPISSNAPLAGEPVKRLSETKEMIAALQCYVDDLPESDSLTLFSDDDAGEKTRVEFYLSLIGKVGSARDESGYNTTRVSPSSRSRRLSSSTTTDDAQSIASTSTSMRRDSFLVNSTLVTSTPIREADADARSTMTDTDKSSTDESTAPTGPLVLAAEHYLRESGFTKQIRRHTRIIQDLMIQGYSDALLAPEQLHHVQDGMAVVNLLNSELITNEEKFKLAMSFQYSKDRNSSSNNQSLDHLISVSVAEYYNELNSDYDAKTKALENEVNESCAGLEQAISSIDKNSDSFKTQLETDIKVDVERIHAKEKRLGNFINEEENIFLQRLALLKAQVSNVLTEHYKKNLKLGNFFEQLYHGSKGITKSQVLEGAIKGAKDYTAACKLLIDFFKDENTSYRDHSFATLLLQRLFRDDDGVFSTRVSKDRVADTEENEAKKNNQVLAGALQKSSALLGGLFHRKSTEERRAVAAHALVVIRNEQALAETAKGHGQPQSDPNAPVEVDRTVGPIN